LRWSAVGVSASLWHINYTPFVDFFDDEHAAGTAAVLRSIADDKFHCRRDWPR
jgi:hypothetical protein